MLTTSSGPSKPDIKRVVDDLLREDLYFDRNENRSAIRENLVRPVVIEVRDSDVKTSGFSRNISSSGIGVITDASISEGTVAVLKIDRLHGVPITILAECRWCRPYGDDWQISGWQFIKLKR